MLDPSEKQVFDGMVTQLRADDPQFVHRIDKLGRPRRRLRRTLAILLWTMAPFCILYGGWTGFFMAVAAAGYGAHLMTRRSRMGDGAGGFSWWSSPGHRPGASI